MNRILKIIFINVILLLLILITSEWICFLIIKHKYEPRLKITKAMNKATGRHSLEELKYNYKLNSFNYENEKIAMRNPEGLNYKKLPIILFGCSFTYGDGLNNNQTFSYKLSHLAKRPVYNRAECGWGVQHMLSNLEEKTFTMK